MVLNEEFGQHPNGAHWWSGFDIEDFQTSFPTESQPTDQSEEIDSLLGSK